MLREANHVCKLGLMTAVDVSPYANGVLVDIKMSRSTSLMEIVKKNELEHFTLQILPTAADNAKGKFSPKKLIFFLMLSVFSSHKLLLFIECCHTES